MIWPGRYSRVPQSVSGCHPSTVSKFRLRCKPMNIGCQNVQTLLDNDCLKSHPERISVIVANELQQYGMDAVDLAETRIRGKKNLVEKSVEYLLFWSGRDKTYKRESQVGIAIRTTLVSKLEELSCNYSNHLMSLRLSLRKGCYATFISAYAPTKCSEEDNKLAFYLSLTEIISSIPPDDKVIFLGDFNARIVADGRHGVS